MSTKNNDSKPWFKVIWIAIVLLAVGLRVIGLSSTPLSPYWEEVALGYDAYSLWETGKDHHGHAWPVVAFESFGDWKPAGYYYLLIPFIATMGLSVVTVRLPAVLAGVLIVIGVGWLARMLGEWWQLGWLFQRGRLKFTAAEVWQLAAMAVTAVSPWSILFSRAAWEVNVATCLIVWGVGAGLQAWKLTATRSFSYRQVAWMAMCGVALVLAMYTYHAARIVAPGLGLALGLGWLALSWSSHGKISSRITYWLMAAVPAGLLVLPLLLALGSPVTSQRFAETSIFTDLSVIERSNELQELANHSWWSRLAYHRYVLFGKEILTNAASHFTPDFLFVSGDRNPRHSIQFMGQLYIFESIFLLIGIVWLLTKGRRSAWLLWWWLAIGILPASITLAAPHALRTLLVMPVLLLLISGGLVQLVGWWQRMEVPWLKVPGKRFALLIGVAVIYLVGLVTFWRFYWLVYPALYGAEWQVGYQHMVSEVATFQAQNPEVPVYITREQGRPAMYYWFFTTTDPRLVQAAASSAKKDQGEFLEFGTISFIRSVDEVTGPGLVVSSQEQSQKLAERFEVTTVDTVVDQRQQPVWVLSRVE